MRTIITKTILLILTVFIFSCKNGNEQIKNEHLIYEINKLLGYDLFSFDRDIISFDGGCGSCGHGAWKIGTVAYDVIYELTPVRQSDPQYLHVLHVKCLDDSDCITAAPEYDPEIWEPKNELKIGFSDQNEVNKVVELLKGMIKPSLKKKPVTSGIYIPDNYK